MPEQLIKKTNTNPPDASLRNLKYAQQATAANTRAAYRSDVRHFLKWGGALPTDTATLIRYCEEHATTLKPSTLKRRLVALKQFHCLQGFPDPTNHPVISKTLRGIANVHGTPPGQAPALLFSQVRTLLNHLSQEDTIAAYRDAALVAIGFFAALRGRELLQIKYEDIQWQDQGLILTIPRSKTDQSGQGQTCAIPKQETSCCPMRLLERWLVHLPRPIEHLFIGINRWQQPNTNLYPYKGSMTF